MIKEISSFVEEAEHIVVLLTNILQKSPIDEEAQLELIKAVKAKADTIIQVLHEEMETVPLMSSLNRKKGSQRLSATTGGFRLLGRKICGPEEIK